MKDVNAKISEHRIFLESLKRDIDSINTKVNEFFRRLEGFCQKSDMPSEFINFRAVTEGRLNGLTSQICSGLGTIKSQRERLDTVEGLVSSLQRSVESAHEIVLSFREGSMGAEKHLANEIRLLKQNVDDRILAHRDNVKQEIGRFKAEVGASPASILDTNQEIAKKVDDALSGVKNAIQQVRGAFDSIRLLEARIKKLEDK